MNEFPRSKFLLLPMLLVALACGDPNVEEAGALELLAQEFPSASDRHIKLMLDALDAIDHVILDLVGREFKSAVFRIACRFDEDLEWSDLANDVPYTCTQAATEWRLYLEWHEETFGPQADPRGLIAAGRNDLLEYLKCESETKGNSECKALESVSEEVGRMALQLSSSVDKGEGKPCLIGTDPGCYP